MDKKKNKYIVMGSRGTVLSRHKTITGARRSADSYLKKGYSPLAIGTEKSGSWSVSSKKRVIRRTKTAKAIKRKTIRRK